MLLLFVGKLERKTHTHTTDSKTTSSFHMYTARHIHTYAHTQHKTRVCFFSFHMVLGLEENRVWGGQGMGGVSRHGIGEAGGHKT